MKTINGYISGFVLGIAMSLAIFISCFLPPYLVAALLLAMNINDRQVILIATICGLFTFVSLIFFGLTVLADFRDFVRSRLKLERRDWLQNEDFSESLGSTTGIIVVVAMFNLLPKLSW